MKTMYQTEGHMLRCEKHKDSPVKTVQVEDSANCFACLLAMTTETKKPVSRELDEIVVSPAIWNVLTETEQMKFATIVEAIQALEAENKRLNNLMSDIRVLMWD